MAADGPITALEFYSGIGGMRYALGAAVGERGHRVLAAFDLNPVANAVYEHNFGDRPVQGNLGSMTAAKLDKYAADLWTMSPPCQPYTRSGLQKGSEDGRAGSFLALLALLPSLRFPPRYLLIENVVGFETSATHRQLRESLTAAGFQYQEFVCTPTQCGVPYSRPRYFCLAKAAPLPFAQPYAHDAIVPHPPQPLPAFADRPSTSADGLEHAGEAEAAQRAGGAEGGGRMELEWDEGACQPISDYLELPGSSENDLWETYGVPEAVIARWRRALDAVTPASTRACCFTKSYYQYLKGTGSLLAHTQEHVAWLKRNEEVEEREENDADSDAERRAAAAGRTGAVAAPRFRYFTPREVANIHGKPEHFSFPQEVTLKQRYALLGNGISVTVVTTLLRYLLCDDEGGLRVSVDVS